MAFEVKFSIIIPAYKIRYFKECIDSIICQTYKNFELIIVNDASPEDLNSIVNAYDDTRIRYYVNEVNYGALNVVDNWNKCLKYATGDYVICMGDDDKLCPNCLAEYAKLIEKYPGIGLLHGWTEIIGEDSIPYKLTTHRCEYESEYSLAWHRWNGYSQQFIGDFCFERKWLLQNGGFYKFPLAWGSDNISAQIGASKNGVANTQTVVFQYRINSQTISNTGDVEQKMDAILLEMEWYRSFMKKEPEKSVDKLYHLMFCEQFDTRFYRLKCRTISSDLKKHSIFRIIHWWKIRKKYHLSNKMLLIALLYSFK